MGLDMYLTGRKDFLPKYGDKFRTEDGFRVTSTEVELYYWRKHQALHDYMVDNLAVSGEDDCLPIDLTIEDLQSIIEDLSLNRIKGATPQEQHDYTTAFTNALKWLEEAPPPDLSPTPTSTELTQALSSVGFIVLEVNEDTFKHLELRTITYRASW